MNSTTATLEHPQLAAHRPRLMKFALRHLRSRAQAEDAVQDTLVAALEGARRYAGQSSVGTWLIGILRHKIADCFRHDAREPRLAPCAEGSDGVEQLFHEDGRWRAPPSDWGDPEAALGQREFFEALERALQRLPEKTARAFHLREVMGLSTEEICQALGVSAQNCWIMLYRARMSLRQSLEDSFSL
ncbi:MAG TPA: sigma-70 family RNA polymerase sigma factor [Burkholderiales bacterium]|nr:sigma-70 family RNA polymerase sigma factor [Burkholderiales bacterium]